MEFTKNYFEIGEYASDGLKLGFGSFATVYQGRHKQTKKVVAIKVVDIERLARNNKKLEEHMRAEISIMKSLHHDNIVQLLDAITGVDRYMYIMLEYCDGGDFAQYLDKQPHRRLTEARAQFFLRQLAHGLLFLRSKKILHRDLKPQNLLVSGKDLENPILKITDFGFARIIEQGSVADTLCGSPLYMAPEILRFQKYTVKADLWSVGIILWEMVSGKPPFKSRNHFELPKVIDSTPLKMDPALNISPVCMDLLTQLLQKDPNNRVSWEEFFSHPFLGFENVVPLPSSPLSLSPLPPSVLEMRGRSVSTPAFPHPHLLPHPKVAPQSPGQSAAQFISALKETSLTPTTSSHGLTPLATSPPSPRNYGTTPSPAASPTPSPSPSPSTSAPPPTYIPPSTSAPPTTSVPLPTPSQPIVAPKLPMPKQRDRAYSTATSAPYKAPTPTPPPAVSMPKVRSAEDLKLQQQDALEREFLLMQDAGSAEFTPDTEERLLEELKQREVRAHVIGEIAELKTEQGERGVLESLSLWLKYLSILHNMLDYAHRVVESKRWIGSKYLQNYADKLKNRFADALVKTRLAKSRVKSNESMLSAERLMFEYALHIGREAAVDEMYRNFMKAEYFYRNGQHLLEQLLQDATDAHDRRILREYISRFAIRLADATRKKEAAYPTSIRTSLGKS